jgi:LETM1 and EF-hand domain-containing protein 1
MCKYMNIIAFGTKCVSYIIGTDPFLRQQINKALAEIKRDDRLIQSEGVDSLTIPELQTAAQARGVRIIGASPARLRSELTQWIHLHVDKQIPSSLLILSRAFSISERIPRDEEEATQGSAQSIQATLSSLPDYVVNEAGLNVAESEGTATIAQKLAFIKDQEELIEDELEQAEVCTCLSNAF